MLGIWSDQAGGFVAVADTEDEISADRADLVADGEDPADLEVCRVCPDHEEQRADACEEC